MHLANQRQFSRPRGNSDLDSRRESGRDLSRVQNLMGTCNTRKRYFKVYPGKNSSAV